MSVEASYILLEQLTLELSWTTVRNLLEQSLVAYQAQDWEQVKRLSQQAQKLSRDPNSLVEHATALLHLGLAWGHLGRLLEAERVISLAKRIFHRNAQRQSRTGEALAELVLGWVYDQSGAAVQYYREALKLLSQLQQEYAAQGDVGKDKVLQQICHMLRLRIKDETPTIYVAGRTFTLTPLAEEDQGVLELECDVEYRIIPVEHDQYSEWGLSPGDSMLVHSVEHLEALVSGTLGICHLPGGDCAVGKFERNTEGNVRFLELGARARIIGDLKAGRASYLDAVLKLGET